MPSWLSCGSLQPARPVNIPCNRNEERCLSERERHAPGGTGLSLTGAPAKWAPRSLHTKTVFRCSLSSLHQLV